MTRRIGIYPGTFDPVHVGHIAFGEVARAACRLDEVVFIPERSPRDKPAATDIHHRIAMLEHATGPHRNLRVAVLESSRFTVAKTLPELRHTFSDAHLTLLIGSDTAAYLHAWEELEQLLPIVTFAIGLRGSSTAEEMRALMRRLEALHHQPAAYEIIPAASTAHVSSSVARSGDLTHVPPSAAVYIQQEHLYS